MKAWKNIAVVLAALLVIMATIFLFFDRILVVILENRYCLSITYKKCSRHLSGEMDFEDLSFVSKRTGLGFTAGNAIIKPCLSAKKVIFDIDLHNVGFIRRKANVSARYDTLMALVSSPFNGRWKYRDLRARLEPGKQGIKIESLDAISDLIRLSLKGVFFYGGAIESDIIIYFAPTVTEKIPQELAKIILANEKDGWKSLSVRVAGDPNRPSIQVSSKLFRLKINQN